MDTQFIILAYGIKNDEHFIEVMPQQNDFVGPLRAQQQLKDALDKYGDGVHLKIYRLPENCEFLYVWDNGIHDTDWEARRQWPDPWIEFEKSEHQRSNNYIKYFYDKANGTWVESEYWTDEPEDGDDDDLADEEDDFEDFCPYCGELIEDCYCDEDEDDWPDDDDDYGDEWDEDEWNTVEFD